ncbi:hypothetical protein [Curtobacterium sp. MCBD17_023]|uniref:hypothetical protein n=1 Tax=Curtobacterium sp. MCBD17_023 TaxID=2175657 RepID=UPI0011B731BC|nr:hypothetical protein [Curtobacterium sp. MCBD17_023]
MTGDREEHYVYTPVMPVETWVRIRRFVEEAVREAAPATAYTEKQLYPVTAKLAKWAVDVAALPLDRSILLDPSTIDEFAHGALVTYTSAGRATMRSKLRAVARALSDSDGADEQVGIRRSAPVEPYSAADLAALESWANGQHSEDRRTSAGTLLALGAGAGLTGREIIAARHGDISRDEQAYLIHVRGTAARSVPVTAEWEHLLERRVSSSSGWLFRDGQEGGNPNLITDFVSRSHQRLNVQARRLRATWLVHHLTLGTPLPILLQAAGLQSAEALDRLLPFVPARSDDDRWRLLRGR